MAIFDGYETQSDNRNACDSHTFACSGTSLVASIDHPDGELNVNKIQSKQKKNTILNNITRGSQLSVGDLLSRNQKVDISSPEVKKVDCDIHKYQHLKYPLRCSNDSLKTKNKFKSQTK